MALVAARKLSETWREAVARQAGSFGQEGAALLLFDCEISAGRTPVEAAWNALNELNCLADDETPEYPLSFDLSLGL
jgi:hypothetical protein